MSETSQMPPVPPDPERLDRVQLLWSLAKFEGKLLLDGLRDLVLAPAAIVAVLFGILEGRQPARYFHQLMELGKRSEHWLNLFGEQGHEHTADRLLEPFERQLAEKLKTTQGLQEIERWLAKAGRGKSNA